jgi:hypothetical protein
MPVIRSEDDRVIAADDRERRSECDHFPGDMYGYCSCPDCGVAVQRARLEIDGHACAPDRHVAHQTMKARRGLQQREDDLARWLGTPAGQFQAFLARRGHR